MILTADNLAIDYFFSGNLVNQSTILINILMGKVALIFGITGQDGSYLADLLLSKNYIVHGVRRRSSSFNSYRIEHLYKNPYENKTKFYLHYGDVTDGSSIKHLITTLQPDEIYNFAAQSHVHVSFETPESSSEVNALGVLKILETIRTSKKKIKFYQASTSEMYGNSKKIIRMKILIFHQSLHTGYLSYIHIG